MEETLNELLEKFDELWAEDDEPRLRSFARMYAIKAFEVGAEWTRLNIMEGAREILSNETHTQEKV